MLISRRILLVLKMPAGAQADIEDLIICLVSYIDFGVRSSPIPAPGPYRCGPVHPGPSRRGPVHNSDRQPDLLSATFTLLTPSVGVSEATFGRPDLLWVRLWSPSGSNLGAQTPSNP